MNYDRIAVRPLWGLRPPSKKAIELQFHWIFVLIAGALILAFFFSLAQKQRTLSQERLQLTLATDIENIFTGAIVSKGTAQKLPVPPQGIAFECSEGCACQFRIERAPKDFGGKAMFAPELLKEQDITVWALEFKLPYRVTNFLYLTNPTIKYYFVHDGQASGLSQSLLKQLTQNIPPLMPYESIPMHQMPSIKEDGNYHTKFILLNVDPTALDDSFKKAQFSAIKIDERGIWFYEKDETSFNRVGYSNFAGLPSLYAAIFAQDKTMYECGLKTAFRKLSYVSKLYAERAAELQQKALDAGKDWCSYGAPSEEDVCSRPNPGTVIGMLCQQYTNAEQLSRKLDEALLVQLNPLMEQLDSQNRNFVQQSCPELF